MRYPPRTPPQPPEADADPLKVTIRMPPALATALRQRAHVALSPHQVVARDLARYYAILRESVLTEWSDADLRHIATRISAVWPTPPDDPAEYRRLLTAFDADDELGQYLFQVSVSEWPLADLLALIDAAERAARSAAPPAAPALPIDEFHAARPTRSPRPRRSR